MIRYEFRFVAALVTLFIGITMCNPIDWTERSRSPYSPTTGRRTSDSNYSSSSVSGGSWRPHHSKTVIHENFQCTEKEQSYFFRSQCSDNGFLTVHRGRVLVQTTGLSDSDSEAEFSIETCSHGSPSDSPILRYRHKKSKKYICFSRKGRVITMPEKRAKSRRAMCMFRQIPIESSSRHGYEGRTYHRLQSVHNSKWHLGFNHKNLASIKGRQPHKAALPRNGHKFRPRKCDYNFFSGKLRNSFVQMEKSYWSGAFEKIKESKKNLDIVSKAANSDREINTNEIGVDNSQKDTVQYSDTKISSVYKERLLQQQELKRTNKRKIRHFKKKRLRLSRREKNVQKASSSRRKQPIMSSKSQNLI